MARRSRLKTYYTPDVLDLGYASHGGSVFPPNMDVESAVKVRCPSETGFLQAAACRLLPETQFGQEQLVFHGTADPDSAVYPAAENDYLRWYAFAPDMSLDFIREEHRIRTAAGKSCASILHVYRVVKPIRNLLLYADRTKWNQLGGAEQLLVNNICGVPQHRDSAAARALEMRARELGCPVEEYLRARGVQRYRIMRGDRGERANGWVRLNSSAVVAKTLTATKGFELMLTCDDHREYLEHVGSYDVVDDSEAYGTVGDDVVDTDEEYMWYMAGVSPVASMQGRTMRRRSAGSPRRDRTVRRLVL